MSSKNKPLRIATIGCGNRASVYLNLIAEYPDRFQITAAADPVDLRVKAIERLARNPEFLSFKSADELLNAPRVADVVIIATQDQYHFDPCMRALQKGYDIVLEKPMTDHIETILVLEREAARLGRRVIVCHVLRYTSFYRKLKEIIKSGILGRIITLKASEGIEPWHFAHSYVRGHWAVMEKSTPTIVAKCCHDMDILHWLLDRKCTRLSSFGHLSFFKAENAKYQDEYPMFDPERYLEPGQKGWLAQVYDHPEASDEEIIDWLRTSKWGRNVFECDNTAVDHQVINLEFESQVTATFTMTAFDEGRNYEIHGTKGSLRAGDYYKEHLGTDILIREHATRTTTRLTVTDENPHPKYGGYHGGGDVGFIKALHELLTGKEPPLTSISASVHSHLIAFAAEEARISGRVIDIEKFYQNHKSNKYALD